MKTLREKRIMRVAFGLSVLGHAAILLFAWNAPEPELVIARPAIPIRIILDDVIFPGQIASVEDAFYLRAARRASEPAPSVVAMDPGTVSAEPLAVAHALGAPAPEPAASEPARMPIVEAGIGIGSPSNEPFSVQATGQNSAPFGANVPGGRAEATGTVPSSGRTAEPGNNSNEGDNSPSWVKEADYRRNPKPAYPPRAREFGLEGKAVLLVVVSTDGRAKSVTIRTTSGHPTLDEAAVESVRRWEFRPAERNGIAIESKVLVPISFRLK